MSSDSSLPWWLTLSPTEQTEFQQLVRQPVSPAPDLLVVGGNLLSLAVAYFATEQGLRVQIVDSRSLATGIPMLGAGILAPSRAAMTGDMQYGEFLQTCRDAWSRLAIRPGMDYQWKVPGLLATGESPLSQSLHSGNGTEQGEGWLFQQIEPSAFADLEPALPPQNSPGYLMPSDAVLNPLRAALSFLRRIGKRQGGMCSEVQIKGVEFNGQGVTKLQTTAGPITPRFLFVATDDPLPGIAEVTPALPRETRYQFLGVTQPVAPRLRQAVSDTFDLFQLRSGEIVVSRDAACPIGVEQASELLGRIQPDAEELRWQATAVWSADSPASRFPRFQISPVNGSPNVWWLPEMSEALLTAVGVAQSCVQWITSGSQPEIFGQSE